MAKELESKKSTEVALPFNLEQDAALGLEGMSTKDYAIPYLTILQNLSPQVVRGPAQIPGASAGDFYNSVTQQIFSGDKGLRVIPCAYQMKWVEWKPREQGGGFVMYHNSEAIIDQCTRNTQNFDVLPNGNTVIPTAYYYALIMQEDGSTEKVIMSLARTQLKKARKWNSIIAGLKLKGTNGFYTPPMFSHVYLLKSTLEANKVNSWFGWNISNDGPVKTLDVYNEAKEFNKSVKEGAASVKAPDVEQETATDEIM